MEVHVLPETSKDVNMSTVRKYYSFFAILQSEIYDESYFCKKSHY